MYLWTLLIELQTFAEESQRSNREAGGSSKRGHSVGRTMSVSRENNSLYMEETGE